MMDITTLPVDTAAIIAVLFSVGLVSGVSPCTLPTVALIVSYVGGCGENSRLRAFMLSTAFVAGFSLTLTVLGFVAGLVGNIFLNLSWFNYVLAGILLIMGLWMLRVINYEGDAIEWLKPKRGSGSLGAFLLGIPFGIVSSPCTMPVTISILTYSASKGSSFYGALLMFFFALGRSLPLLIIGTFTGILTRMNKFESYQNSIQKIGGTVMVVIAFYYIWVA